MTGRPKGWLQQALTEHLGLKAIAVIASVGLFIIVRGTEDAQTSVPVDVVALLPPPNTPKMLVSEIPDEVRVTLRGSRSVLNTVRREGVQPIQMDLRDTSAHFYYFDPEELALPAGLSIVQIAPAAVPLTWVDRDERTIAVEPALEGALADGLVLRGTPTAEPRAVRLRGPASEVNRLRTVRTEAVDIASLGPGTHERRVPLVPPPEHTIYPDTVSVVVRLHIDEQEGTRLLEASEISVVGGVLTLRPDRVRVRVTGARVAVEALDPSLIVPWVDASAFDPARGAQSLAVQLRGLPEGLSATALPAEVLAGVPAARPNQR